MDIEVIFLGTSAGIPTETRNVSSVLVRRKDEMIFFDFGEGTQRQLFKGGYGLGSKIKIFITHIHGDHIFGLFPALQTMSLFRRTRDLEIYGPAKLWSLIKYCIDILNVELPFQIKFKTVTDGSVFKFDEYEVRAIKNSHTSWSFSYRLQEYGREGRFDSRKASSEGIPIRLWKVLASGRDVKIGNKFYSWRDFIIGPPIKGRSITYSGDTQPFDRMVDFAKESDVLIHEATFTDDLIERSQKTLHTTARQAAVLAKKANVKVLVLTHFSARYKDTSMLLREAREIFPASFIANDLDKIVIPYVKPKPIVG